MSTYVEFRSEKKRAHIVVYEWYYAHALVLNMLRAAMEVYLGQMKELKLKRRLCALMKDVEEDYLNPNMDEEKFARRFWLRLVIDDVGSLVWKGKTFTFFELAADTAMLLGSRPVQFLACFMSLGKAHGDLPNRHGYIEGEDRSWAADIIEEGLRTGVMRTTVKQTPVGWQELIPLLRSSQSLPVIMVHPVSPHASALDSGWDEAVRWVRTQEEILRISPQNLHTKRFTGIDGLWLAQQLLGEDS